MSILASQSANRAILVLADGTIFRGTAIGAEGSAVGEVVFNTAMTGYQEILTDPSYTEQLVTLTYPHIGNTGTNNEDQESDNVWARGLIIRDNAIKASNFRKQETLSEYLQRHNVVGIADIDTRKLTRILRDKGAQNGCIMAGELDDQQALEMAQKFPGLKGMDLAKEVCCKEAQSWVGGSWKLGQGHTQPPRSKYHVVAYDYGCKHNILRLLADRNCKITLVPAQTPASEVMALNPDGVFLSNGPGDPEPCDYAIKAIQQLLDNDIPIFGICLGHQLLGLASGAKSVKMKLGHHGANHPVQDTATRRVMITSQNHGFALDIDSLPNNLEVTHVSLFDGTLQGIKRKDKPAFSFQGHPEASPGPHDAEGLFDQFIQLMQEREQATA